MGYLGDRRLKARFEVVGPLSGLVERVDHARVLNISTCGALVVSSLAPVIDSTMTVRLAIADAEVSVGVRIRHFQPLRRGPRLEYMVGLEFLSMPASLTSVIEDLAVHRFEGGLL